MAIKRARKERPVRFTASGARTCLWGRGLGRGGRLGLGLDVRGGICMARERRGGGDVRRMSAHVLATGLCRRGEGRREGGRGHTHTVGDHDGEGGEDVRQVVQIALRRQGPAGLRGHGRRHRRRLRRRCTDAVGCKLVGLVRRRPAMMLISRHNKDKLQQPSRPRYLARATSRRLAMCGPLSSSAAPSLSVCVRGLRPPGCASDQQPVHTHALDQAHAAKSQGSRALIYPAAAHRGFVELRGLGSGPEKADVSGLVARQVRDNLPYEGLAGPSPLLPARLSPLRIATVSTSSRYASSLVNRSKTSSRGESLPAGQTDSF
jgi:hypothetical protein